MVQATQFAVDLNKRLDRITLILNLASVRHNLRHNLLNEAVLERNVAAAKFFGKDFVPELSGGFITGGIAGNDLHRSVRRLIILKSEKREADILLAFDRVSGKEMRTNLHAGNLGIVGHPVHDTLRSALIDVMLSGKHLQPRRLNLESKISGDVRSISLEKVT